MNILHDERLDGVLPMPDRTALLHKLSIRLPDLHVLHSEEALRPYECDGLAAYRSTPLLVVLPETLEQVQIIPLQDQGNSLAETILHIPSGEAHSFTVLVQYHPRGLFPIHPAMDS